MPAAVSTVVNQPQVLRVDFKCRNCDHQWSQDFGTRSTAVNLELPRTAEKK